MQVSETDVAAHLDRLVAEADLSRRGLQAWDALLRAHATLMRQLETDLERKTGLALADFDVLAQLAIAGGALRIRQASARGHPAGENTARKAAARRKNGLQCCDCRETLRRPLNGRERDCRRAGANHV